MKLKKLFSVLALLFILGFVAPQIASANSSVFIWPADGELTGKFGDSRDGGTRDHIGIDIAKKGSAVPVISTYEGRVVGKGFHSTAGNYVNVEHSINGKNVITKYFHLSAIHVNDGQTVSKGQRLGYMGNTGKSFGQHLHFEVHFDGGAKDPLKVLKGDYDYLFNFTPNFQVHHSTQGHLKSFTTLAEAKNHSNKYKNTAVIRSSDGKQVYTNGLKTDNYTVFHSVHQALASFSIKQNAIDYSKRWQNTVVRDNGDRSQVYAREELGQPRYEVFHTSQGVLGEFHFAYLARGQMNYYQHTITIDKNTGQQIAQHPNANGPQFEVYHTKHDNLATFSFLSAATRYSNNWQNTVVIDQVTKKQLYARSDLGSFNFVVKNNQGVELAKFHFLSNAEVFAGQYNNGTVVIEQL